MSRFDAISSFIVLLAMAIISTSSSNHYVASAFVNSCCSFVTKSKPPSIHQHLHIVMGKRQQHQRQNKGNKRNNKKKQSLESLLELETDLHGRGFKYVIGSDVSHSHCIVRVIALLLINIRLSHHTITPGFRRSRLHCWTCCCGKLLRDAAIFFSLWWRIFR